MEDKKRFMYEVYVELNDVCGFLCVLLKSSFSDFEVEVLVLSVFRVEYELICFLGFGVISNVFCVKDEDDREYVVKILFYGKNL